MQAIARFLTKIIDFFYDLSCRVYPPVSHLCTREIFRYGACGGGNMVLDWVLYFLFYHFLLGFYGSVVYLEIQSIHMQVAITPHIFAFCLTFPITLLTGFLLNKYITFTQSSLRGWHQLYRYIVIVLINVLINYLGLKFFIEFCHFYPTPSKMLVTLLTVIISFFGQKYYSFRQ